MAEIMSQLEKLAYLAGSAASVADRRELDELLRETDTQVDGETVETESLTTVAA
jgi:hypothetical protein